MSAQTPPTDYYSFILDVLRRTKPQESSSNTSAINQSILRHCLGLASSFLVTDLTTSPSGITTWSMGFRYLVDVVVALHNRGELEIDTLSAASKACSECWTGMWRDMANCREDVRNVAGKLKKLLDEGGRTYRGNSGSA
ncbi:hypothetical protein AN958_05440 [Leucoagaricus sp. SymC.cos]|nr:hypothetical protein AN958_05440 [Leucoagaricus sp. SymC.cos]